MPSFHHRSVRLFVMLAVAATVACGQHYSEKEADDALSERGLVPMPAPGAATTPPGHPPITGSLAAGQVAIGQLVGMLPPGWTAQSPSSSMRVAQFAVSDDGGASAELAVFEGNWGTVDDNVSRWIGQFTQPDGSATESLTKRWEIRNEAGTSITMVDIPGTYGGGMGGGGTQQNYRMLGAIVPAQGTFYYLKFTGPDALVTAERETFERFVSGLQGA